MKFKPAKDHGLVVELGGKDTQLLAESDEPSTLPVFQLKKILVPVDFSDCSRKALRYAVPFARQFGASLELVFVVQSYTPVPEMGTIDFAELEKQARAQGEERLRALKESEIAGRVPANATVRTGNVYQEIVQTAKLHDVDLIILSTHGRTGLKHVLMGSVAEHVVRYAPCPVLVVREYEHEFIRTETGSIS